MSRNEFIDFIRGWGIILVIWGHSSSFLYDEIYSFHMPLFFFLSGCFFKWKGFTLWQYTKKKFSQLLIPYYIFFTLIYIYYAIVLTVTHRFDLVNVVVKLKGIFPLDNTTISTPLWFFYALFFMSLIYMMIRRLMKNNTLILIVVCLGVGLLQYLLMVNNIELPLFIGRSLGELVYMHLGYWAYQAWKPNEMLKKKIHQRVFFLFLSFLFFYFCYYVKTLTSGFFDYGISIITTLSGIIFSICLCACLQPVKKLNKAIGYLGTHTLCLFALHLPLFEIARPCAKLLWGIENIPHDITVFSVALLLSIIAGELLMMIFPKYLGVSSFAKNK